MPATGEPPFDISLKLTGDSPPPSAAPVLSPDSREDLFQSPRKGI